jgi:hypothetical protein
MASSQSERFASCLAQRAGEAAGAARLADAMLAVAEDIATCLYPIIGRQGVVALYRRSVHLVSAGQPWMAALLTNHPKMDLEALQLALAEQDGATAVVAGEALLTTFYDLLVSLVGERSMGNPTQEDTSP